MSDYMKVVTAISVAAILFLGARVVWEAYKQPGAFGDDDDDSSLPN